MNQKPIVSIIVPLYNAEDTLRDAVDSVINQTIDPHMYEIILVNDGSQDATGTLCEEYAARFDNVRALEQANAGVSAARNLGMSYARGKYIGFLDGDDTLAADTLEAATSYFEQHYDDIDIVVYPRILLKHGKKTRHVSLNTLKFTGVYDLSMLKNAFALVTMLNVLVKNNKDLPKFNNEMFMHEDELFLMDIILRREKIGFVNQGAYYYKDRADSAVHLKMHPFYQFELNMKMWEDLFSRYSSPVPKYLQASYFNELCWKLRQDVLFPYHYPPQEYEVAVNRIWNLLARVDLDVIVECPNTDIYHKVFFLRKSYPEHLAYSVSSVGLSITFDRKVIFFSRTIEMMFLKTRIVGDSYKIIGFLKSPIFTFCDQMPKLELIAETEYGEQHYQCKLYISSWSYHRSKTFTNLFWGFDMSIDISTIKNFTFEVEMLGARIPVTYYFAVDAGFSSKVKRWKYVSQGIGLEVDGARHICISRDKASVAECRQHADAIAKRGNRRAFLIRSVLNYLPKRKNKLWLYYDRGAVGRDNAYYQFVHDMEIRDDVDRYYVTSLGKARWAQEFGRAHLDRIVSFDSYRHKLLHLQADLLLVAYIEQANWFPFNKKSHFYFADLFHYGIVHLQHGVLHAHQPWKHSYDRLLVDCEVISTHFESNNFVEQYRFPQQALLSSGMPRYDFIDASARPKKKILFAPSWRKYLVHQTPTLEFEPLDQEFLKSQWWKETYNFLTSESLRNTLQKYDYSLDVKLHPILGVYSGYFKFDDPRIRLVSSVTDSDYEVFITDYSSWVFDFVYLNRKILYFVPDYDVFLSGMNSYRELDIPLESGFGPLCKTGESAASELEKILSGSTGGEPFRATEGFFLHYDNRQRDRLYESIRRRIASGDL